MAGFTFVKNLSGSHTGLDSLNDSFIIANSETIYKGAIVKLSSSFINAATATHRVFGLVKGVVTPNGVPIDNADSTEYDGTITAGGVGVGNYAASADNETDKQIRALVKILQPGDIVSGTTDGTFGTNNSDTPGYYTDLITSILVDEDSASGSDGQLFIYMSDPNNSSNMYYIPCELQTVR